MENGTHYANRDCGSQRFYKRASRRKRRNTDSFMIPLAVTWKSYWSIYCSNLKRLSVETTKTRTGYSLAGLPRAAFLLRFFDHFHHGAGKIKSAPFTTRDLFQHSILFKYKGRRRQKTRIY